MSVEQSIRMFIALLKRLHLTQQANIHLCPIDGEAQKLFLLKPDVGLGREHRAVHLHHHVSVNEEVVGFRNSLQERRHYLLSPKRFTVALGFYHGVVNRGKEGVVQLGQFTRPYPLAGMSSAVP